MITTKRHPRLARLTEGLTQDEFAEWIRLHAAETEQDTEKIYFRPEDVSEFEHESSANGREFNRLNDLKKKFDQIIKKGCEEDVKFTIPATVGTKSLEVQRRQNDDLIEKGYEETEIEVFGIVNTDAEIMEYFTIEGEMLEKRNRELTPKEKHKYLGMFMRTSRIGNSEFDENTGEEIRKASGQ